MNSHREHTEIQLRCIYTYLLNWLIRLTSATTILCSVTKWCWISSLFSEFWVHTKQGKTIVSSIAEVSALLSSMCDNFKDSRTNFSVKKWNKNIQKRIWNLSTYDVHVHENFLITVTRSLLYENISCVGTRELTKYMLLKEAK